MNVCLTLLLIFVVYCMIMLFFRMVVPQNAQCLHIVIISPDTPDVEHILRWNWLCVCYCVLLGGGRMTIADDSMTPYQRHIVELFIRGKEVDILPLDDFALEELSLQYNQIRIVT